MPNTWRGREDFFPYDHELERTLRNMNQNMGIHDDDPNQNIPAPVDVHGQLLPDDPSENQQREQNPAPLFKNTIEAMIILQTLMGHFSCPLYHRATPLW